MTVLYLIVEAFLICILVTTKPFRTYSFSIKLIPIDRFDTMLFPMNLTLEERYQRISEISQARVCQLKSTVSSCTMDRKEAMENKPNALQPEVVRSKLNYYITNLRVGARRYTANFVVDTGSVTTWVQCEGCSHCFFITQGNFDRSQSRSYRPLPCNHPLCVPRLCEKNICMYDVSYGGSTYSKGQVRLDTFFYNDRGGLKGFPDTVFGCGLDNYNHAWGAHGQRNSTAGIFGLGLGKQSIFMQYANETKNRISYCLPSFYAGDMYTYLRFGDDAQIDGRPGIMTTRLIPNVATYAVEVIDISVQLKRLNIDPAVFRMRSDRTGGFILDTGSPHTFLLQPAYNIVKGEIVDYFVRHYDWHPYPPQPGQLDLCYNMPHRNFTAPSMTFHFQGANLFLPARNVFLFLDAKFCWMVMPMHYAGPNILGALQQANHRFLFDFTAFTVSYVPEVCRYPNFVGSV